MNKKVMYVVSVIMSLLVLVGCGSTSNKDAEITKKKAEAVKVAKATVGGLLQGDKSVYDEYYGQGKFDEKMKEELSGKGIFLNTITEGTSEEIKKTRLDYFQKLFSKSKIDYEEKSETEVTISIHKMRYDVTELNSYMEEINWHPIAETTDISEITEVLMKGVEAGKIKLEEKEIVKETLQFEEKEGKLYIKSPSPEDVMGKMITSETDNENVQESTQAE